MIAAPIVASAKCAASQPLGCSIARQYPDDYLRLPKPCGFAGNNDVGQQGEFVSTAATRSKAWGI